jgi:hypothetical protein
LANAAIIVEESPKSPNCAATDDGWGKGAAAAECVGKGESTEF